tara:strand:- start:277 stop:900 length:624 start_codon:yes stop_codon:yes gene_type:complete
MSLVTLNDRAVRSVTTFGSVGGDSIVFIKKLTASSSGTLSFVDGSSSVVLDSTYKEYMFIFNNIHPASDSVDFQFNLSVDGGSNYNVTKTTTFFRPYQQEGAEESGALEYVTPEDLAQSTAFQSLADRVDNDNDSSCSGTLHLFNPSSTTFVKHFMSNFNRVFGDSPIQANDYMAGYGNTTSAVDAVQFKFSSGNIDAGDICLYGIN